MLCNDEQFAELQSFDIDGTAEWMHKDVVVKGKEKTALFVGGVWYLIPVNFKFGINKHRGQPYLSCEQNLIEMVDEKYLSTLPIWNYSHEIGLLTHNGVEVKYSLAGSTHVLD